MADVIKVKASETESGRRRVWFDLRDATDGISAETGENGGQPEISTNGSAWVTTGIGTLTAIGNGRYYADVTQATVSTVGTFIKTRFKSANTAETPGDWIIVVADDPFQDSVTTIAAQVVASLSGNIGVVVLPTTSQQMTLAEAVAYSESAMNDSESTSEDSTRTENIRNAIRMIASDMINNTPINHTEATFTATIGDPELDLSSVAGFRAERFIRAQIDFKPPLGFKDYAFVSRELDATSGNGTPEYIAFDTATKAYVSPRPETAASIKIKYSLAANTLSSDMDTIQIPAEYLRPALWWGVPALLRYSNMEPSQADVGWRRYQDVVKKLNGVGTANRGHFEMDLTKFN